MLKLGCIADDFATALDLADNLVDAGMRVVLTRGVPSGPLERAFTDTDAVVVALSTRNAPVAQSRYRALNALVWLKAAGVVQIFLASNPSFEGPHAGEHPANVAPVIDALMDALETDFSLLCPAYPARDWTLARGHLFVGDTLLSESRLGLAPGTPARDANLLRVLGTQTRRTLERIDQAAVGLGSVAVQERMAQMRLNQVELALADASSNEDLLRIGQAVKGMALVAGSAALGLGLPQNFDILPTGTAGVLPAAHGHAAVVCGSCSERSAEQVQRFHGQGHPAMAIDPLKIAKFGPQRVAQAAAAWAAPLLARGPVLLYSTASADAVQAVQSLLGVAVSTSAIDACLAEITANLVQNGVRRLVLGGSQTAQTCIKGLGLRQLLVGEAVAPGAPWCYAPDPGATPKPGSLPGAAAPGLHLCIKPGQAGEEDFFSQAFAML